MSKGTKKIASKKTAVMLTMIILYTLCMKRKPITVVDTMLLVMQERAQFR